MCLTKAVHRDWQSVVYEHKEVEAKRWIVGASEKKKGILLEFGEFGPKLSGGCRRVSANKVGRRGGDN